MTRVTGREIPEEIYRRAMENHGSLSEEDKEKVWDRAERWGYGIYGYTVYEKDGKFYVDFSRGSSCD